VSVVYGVTGGQVQVSGRVTEAPRGARALLVTRAGRRNVTRARATVRNGRVRLSWRYPPGIRTATIRVRVIPPPGRRPRVIAVSRSRTLRIAGVPRGRPVANVKAPQVRSAPVPGQSGEVVLNAIRSVRVGEVLALGVGTATPDGLLARITAVSQRAGRTVLRTVPATLTEVLPSADLDVQLEPRTVRTTRAVIRQTVRCTGGAVLRVTGNAGVTAGVDLRVNWTLIPFRITARFVASVQARARVEASISGQGRCALGPIQLLPRPITLGHFTFAIGPVPIVLTPKVQVSLSGDTCFQASARASASAALGVSAGVQYANGGSRRSAP